MQGTERHMFGGEDLEREGALPWQLDSSERKGRQSAKWSQRLSSGTQPGEPSHTSSPSSHCSRAGGDRERGGLINVYQMAKNQKHAASGCLRCTKMQTYGSCTRPPPQDSRPRCRSAVWTARSCCPNTGTVQLDSPPAGGRCPGPGPDKTLRLTCQHSPARRHTSSSLGGTESSTRTGTGPRHRSEAGESPALARPVRHKFHINAFVLG